MKIEEIMAQARANWYQRRNGTIDEAILSALKEAEFVVVPKTSEIYMLMMDVDGTTFSRPRPTGEYVTSEEEAIDWVKAAHPGYSRDYEKIVIAAQEEGDV